MLRTVAAVVLVTLITVLAVMAPPFMAVPVVLVVLWVVIEAATHPDKRQRRVAEANPAPALKPPPPSTARIEAELLAWTRKAPNERFAVYERLRHNLIHHQPHLDLRGLNLNILPPVLKQFGHLKKVTVSPEFLMRIGMLHRHRNGHALPNEEAVGERLGGWFVRTGQPAEHIGFFMGHFQDRSTHVDIRGRNLDGLPDVLADYPDLRSISMSVDFLTRAAPRVFR